MLVFAFAILILFAQFISMTYISVFTNANGKFDSKTIYYTLLNFRLSKLSDIYEGNSSLPGYETYMEVLNGTYSNCSIYSWMLLINCERVIFTWNATALVDKLGENETANIMLNRVKEKLQVIEENLSVELKTIACVEWLSLAKRNYDYGKLYFSWAKESYGKGNFNATFAYLTQSYVYLCKAEDEFKIAFERNKEPATTHEQNKIERAMKKLSLSLINNVNSSLKNTANIERTDLTNYSKRVLSTAKRYYDNESYYFALMYAAEAKATLKYAYLPVLTNCSEALKQAEKFVKWAEGNLTKVYFDPNVDAPLAEYNFELAKLYLQDASSEEEDFAAVLLADTASQTALIASEQAKQALRVISEVESLENVGENEGEDEALWEKISMWDLIAFIGGLVAIPVTIYLIFIKYGGKIFKFRLGGRRK